MIHIYVSSLGKKQLARLNMQVEGEGGSDCFLKCMAIFTVQLSEPCTCVIITWPEKVFNLSKYIMKFPITEQQVKVDFCKEKSLKVSKLGCNIK